MRDALNPSISVEHSFLQGTNAEVTARTRSDSSVINESEGLVGLEYEARWLDGANVMKRSATDYHLASWAGQPVSPPGEDPDDNIYFGAPNDTREYEGSSSRRKTFSYENSYGNWTELKEYAAAGDANWYRRTKRLFAMTPNTEYWILEKPYRVDVYACDRSVGLRVQPDRQHREQERRAARLRRRGAQARGDVV